MNRRIIPLAAVLVLAWVGVCRGDATSRPAAAVTRPVYAADATLADFDAGPPPARTGGVVATIDGDAFAGAGSLKLTPVADLPAKTPRTAEVPLASAIDPARAGGVRFALRARGAEKQVQFRLGWLDEQGRLVLQRTVTVPADGGWHTVALPLHGFRWGAVASGWDNPRALRIAVESPFEAAWFDDLRLTPTAATDGTPAERMAKFAFEGRDYRSAASDGLLVATDAVEAIADADLLRYRGQMQRSQKLISRLFGDAVRPIADPAPATLLIFKDVAGYQDYWRRRGAAWSVRILPPNAGGYTVQDVATSSFDAKAGVDRPVYLHESVHAVAARLLRLQPGQPAHSWLQEALANYVQLCVYPQSLPPEAYPRLFAGGVKDAPDSLFRPLKKVLNEPVTGRQYAQLASLMAYLAEQKPDWLPPIAKAVADGEPLEPVFDRLQTSHEKLEADWLAWGRARFAQPREDAPFEVPAEFK
jgi:hypothetical protein